MARTKIINLPGPVIRILRGVPLIATPYFKVRLVPTTIIVRLPRASCTLPAARSSPTGRARAARQSQMAARYGAERERSIASLHDRCTPS